MLEASDWRCTFEGRQFDKDNWDKESAAARVVLWLRFYASMQGFTTGRLKPDLQRCLKQYPNGTFDALIIDPEHENTSNLTSVDDE